MKKGSQKPIVGYWQIGTDNLFRQEVFWLQKQLERSRQLRKKYEDITVWDCINKSRKQQYAIISNGIVTGFTKPALLGLLAGWFRRKS